MSTKEVENIPVRLREELERLGLTLAQASRQAGEAGTQRLKDVVGGKQRCPVDLLARLAPLGVDIFYVMTGNRQALAEVREEGASYGEEKPKDLSHRELAILELFNKLDEDGQREIQAAAEKIAEMNELRRRVAELEKKAG